VRNLLIYIDFFGAWSGVGFPTPLFHG
jgi:hypothetical protein